jgi:hypothetical protein
MISAAVLTLALGAATPAFAQHEQQGEKQDRPAEQQSKPQQAKPKQQHAQQQQQKQEPNNQQPAQRQQKQEQNNQQRAQQQQRQKQDQNKQAEQHAQQQQKQDQNNQAQQHAQQQQKQDQNQNNQAQQKRNNQRPERTQEQQRVQQASWQQHESRNWDSDHRNWQQRGGYDGYRIPDDRYRGYFGSNHGFRIYGLPFLVVGGYPRFQYEGYWISLVDPWPQYWGNDWYDNDDVYVAYVDNGYYLYNNRYPSVGIAINISR